MKEVYFFGHFTNLNSSFPWTDSNVIEGFCVCPALGFIVRLI
jgi:hypothetical protein